MKRQNTIGFADIAVMGRKIKVDFFNQLDKLVDWKQIEKTINRYYNKGESVAGRPSYEGLVLFKMCLLQTWYGLSDYEVEEQVNDRISFSKFAGISLDNPVPDHSVISRFRTELSSKNAYDSILDLVNQQLERNSIIVKQGCIVDASITDSPRKPKGKKTYEVVEDRKEDDNLPSIETTNLKEQPKPGVDTEAKWIKKAGKLRYGYKKHIATDENGLIISLVTTSANESDIKNLEKVLTKAKLKKGSWVKADKGYKSFENDQIIKKLKLKNHIMHKATKSKILSERELLANKLISTVRYKVERTFGSIVRWFGAGKARYVGKAKTHTQHLMEAIAYNLYRAPGIIMSNCQN